MRILLLYFLLGLSCAQIVSPFMVARAARCKEIGRLAFISESSATDAVSETALLGQHWAPHCLHWATNAHGITMLY